MTTAEPSGPGTTAAPASRQRGERGLIRTLLTALALSPLFFLPDAFYPYVVPRALLLYLLAQLCALHLIWRGLAREVERRDTAEPFLWLLAAFVAWSLVGAVAGDAPIRSLFGDFERMGGVWRWVNFGLLFLWLRAVPDRRDWRYFWGAVLAVTGLLAAVAVYQHHGGPWRVPVPAGGDRVPGTFGNPGYLAAYLLLALGPAALAAVRSEGNLRTAGATGVGAAALYALVLTGTRAAVGGLAIAGLAVALGFGLRRWRGGETRSAAGVAVGLLVLAAVAVGAWLSGLSLSGLEMLVERTLEGDGLQSRFLAWGVALAGFPDAPILGVGMENFALLFGEHFDPDLYVVNPQATRWDRAHNLLLDRLTMTGAVGLLLYLGMWAVLLRDLARLRREGGLAELPAVVFLAGLLAYGIFLVFWFEDHASLLLFLATAAWLRCERAGPMLRAVRRRDRIPGKHRLLLVLSVLVLAGVAYRYEVQPLRAAKETVAGVRADWAGPAAGPATGPATAPSPASAAAAGADTVFRENRGSEGELADLEHFRRALDRTDVMKWTVVARYTAALEAASRRLPPLQPDGARAQRLADHVRRAAREVESALAWDARNPMVYVRKGQLYTAAFRFFRRRDLMEVATESFREAIRLNPRRIRFRHMLANTYLSAGRADDAIAQLDTARRIYPHFGETYYSYGAAYLTRGELERSVEMVWAALDREYVPANTELLVEILRRLRASGDDGRAAGLARDYLAFRYAAYRRSGEATSGDGAAAGPASPSAGAASGELQRVRRFALREPDVPIAARLPVLYLRLGERRNAEATGQRLLIGLLGRREAGLRHGDRIDRVLRFLADLRGGRIDRWRRAGSVFELEAPSGSTSGTGAAPTGPASSTIGGPEVPLPSERR